MAKRVFFHFFIFLYFPTAAVSLGDNGIMVFSPPFLTVLLLSFSQESLSLILPPPFTLPSLSLRYILFNYDIMILTISPPPTPLLPLFHCSFFYYFTFIWSTYGPPFLLFILLPSLELLACMFLFLFIFGVSYYASMIQYWRHHHHQKIGLGIFFYNFFIVTILCSIEA